MLRKQALCKDGLVALWGDWYNYSKAQVKGSLSIDLEKELKGSMYS